MRESEKTNMRGVRERHATCVKEQCNARDRKCNMREGESATCVKGKCNTRKGKQMQLREKCNTREGNMHET